MNELWTPEQTRQAATPTWHRDVPGELGHQVILDGDRELVHQLVGDPDWRAGGCGHGQRVPDTDRQLPGLSGARGGEADPRRRTRAAWDAALARYPRLPITRCAGFERR